MIQRRVAQKVGPRETLRFGAQLCGGNDQTLKAAK